MTEEIIDLIDCPAIEYIAVGNQYFCKVNSCDCAKISTCGYKRLEQERDELKKTVENQRLEYEELQCDLSEVENACGCYQSENAELKQENKELKEYSQRMENQRENYYKEYNKYRSALEEIRKKVKNPITLSCFASAKFVLEQIDKKINEVLNG